MNVATPCLEWTAGPGFCCGNCTVRADLHLGDLPPLATALQARREVPA